MPNIRQYNNTQTIEPQPLEQAAYRVERAGMIEGAAIRQGAAQAVKAVGDVEQHYAEQETSDLSQKISNLDLAVTQQYEDAKQKGDVSDPNFVSNFITKNIQPELDKLGDGLITKQGQTMFREASATMVREYAKRGIADQAAFAGNQAVSNYKNTVTQYANMASLDPTTTDHAANMMSTLASSLPAEHRPELLGAAQEQIYTSGAKGYLDTALKNPNATPQSLDAAWNYVSDPKNGFVAHVNPDTFSALQKQYEQAKETLGATQSQIAALQWPKILTAVKEGDPAGMDAAQQFIGSYHGKTAADTVVDVAKYNSELQDAQDFFKASSTYRDMPQPEISAQYDTLKQQAQAGDKFAKAAVQAIDTRWQEYHADPMSYVLQNNAVVQTRYGQYAQDPTPQNYKAFADAATAEQQRLYPGETPKLVTKDMAHSLSTQLAAIPRTPDGAAQVAQTLSEFATTTGSYWPQVSAELAHDHVLNSEQAVAASLWSDPTKQGVAQELLRASMLPKKDLDTGGVSYNQAAKAARQALADFRTAMIPQTNGAEIYGNYASSLTMLLQVRGNITDAPALAKQLINDEYQFSGTLMVPAAAKVDLHQVVAGTRSIQADLGNEKRHDLVIPPSYSGTGSADQRAEYIRDVQKSGYWIMSGDNKGAMLVTERGDPVYEHVKGRTQQIIVPWDQLQKIGGQ